MFKIYGIKNCSSMKKAFDALDAQQIKYEFHDYKKHGIDANTLSAWLEQVDASILLNKKGTTWRKLTTEQQSYALENQQQLIETLIAQPSLIKRPVLDTDQGLIVGFDENNYSKLQN